MFIKYPVVSVGINQDGTGMERGQNGPGWEAGCRLLFVTSQAHPGQPGELRLPWGTAAREGAVLEWGWSAKGGPGGTGLPVR